MAESKIEWTDYTFNPWRGCTKVSPACQHCYAETLSKRNPATLGTWGPNGNRVVAAEPYWKTPLKWNKKAQDDVVRRRVFCASLADVFEDWGGPMTAVNGDRASRLKDGSFSSTDMYIGRDILRMDDVRRRLFALIDATPYLDWLLLTKRPENVRRMWPSADVFDSTSEQKAYWPNVWLGTTVENQEQADKRRGHLQACRDLAANLFVSSEPRLGPINWHGWEFVDQIISGGESGQHARPPHPDWFRSDRDWCQHHGVAFFFKQWGEYVDELHPAAEGCDSRKYDDSFVTLKRQYPGGEIVDYDGLYMARVGKKAAGRSLDGREWNEFPSAEGGARCR